MRTCTKCNETKSLDYFYFNKKWGKHYPTCKVCMSQSKTPSNFAHTYYKERFSQEELDLFSKLKNLCTKAKLRNQDFDPDVDWEYLFDIWTDQNGKCAYSGLPLSIEANDPHTVSLDRIDSSKGYVKRNLQLLSATVNKMKMDLDANLFIDLCSNITNNLKR